MSDKELIWVSADFAKRYNAVESDAEKIKQFEEFLAGVSAQSKADHIANLESMEEEVAIYRGAMLKAKQSWSAAKDEALAASYTLWEQFDKERPNVNKKIATMISDLQPLLDKTSQLNSALSNLPVYQLEKVVDLLERMQRLDDRTRTMFESVVKASGE
jgi:hypothetical protein